MTDEVTITLTSDEAGVIKRLLIKEELFVRNLHRLRVGISAEELALNALRRKIHDQNINDQIYS